MNRLSKYIIFQLNKQDYGINIEEISSIEKIQDITKIPHTSDFIKGVINLRGEVIAIIDLTERLGMGKTESTNKSHEVLIANFDQIKVGLIVDIATDVIDISDKEIETVSNLVGDIYKSNPMEVANFDDKMIILLNSGNILNHSERYELQELVTLQHV